MRVEWTCRVSKILLFAKENLAKSRLVLSRTFVDESQLIKVAINESLALAISPRVSKYAKRCDAGRRLGRLGAAYVRHAVTLIMCGNDAMVLLEIWK